MIYDMCECEQNGKCRYRLSTSGATDTGYVNLAVGDEWKLMETVATVGPVSAAIDASQSSFRFYDRGITVLSTCFTTQTASQIWNRSLTQ